MTDKKKTAKEVATEVGGIHGAAYNCIEGMEDHLGELASDLVCEYMDEKHSPLEWEWDQEQDELHEEVINLIWTQIRLEMAPATPKHIK